MAQRIAVVDSANGSIIEATVSLQARGTPIRGAFTVFMTDSDVVLGRISKTALTNPFHENPLFAPLIMTKGSIPFWSGEVDIEKATIEIISVKDRKTMERIPLRRNPPSGTDVYLADQATMEQFAVEREHFLVLGHVPNSDGLLCSVVNRNYAPAFDLNGEYDLGGYGEARHMGIFGQNGSAETILLTTTAAGRLAAHPQMGSLILDTSGDLADPTRHSRGKYRWNYDDVLKAVNLTMERIPIADIQLTSTDTLVEKLHPVLRKRINMGPEHARKLADAVVVDLFGMNDVNANQIQTSDILELAKRNINGCYSSTTKGKDQDVENIIQNATRVTLFDREIAQVRALFAGLHDMRGLMRDVLTGGRKIIIEMRDIHRHDHQFVVHECMKALIREANSIYHSGGTANAQIILDEMQRWLPKGKHDLEELAGLIEDGFRSTRKLGIGWIFVAQSPANVSNDALQQCHTWYVGRNLSGVDLECLKSRLGEQGVDCLSRTGGPRWLLLCRHWSR